MWRAVAPGAVRLPAAAAVCLCLGLCLRPCLAIGPARGRDLSVALPGQGVITGREVQVLRNQKAIAYLKIKYHALTLPHFRAPNASALPPLDEPADSSQWPPACMQDPRDLERTHAFFRFHERMHELDFSNDCLYLNIFTPDGAPPSDGWPVMVWIHPGEFVSGAISLWDGSTLAVKQKVIIVTIAYRLNMYGFWTDGNPKYPGNYGLLDQVAALRWIKEKISLFKGSPNDICLFGYDAGAISIGLHMLANSPSAGLFNRAIAMSGNAFIPGAVKSIKAFDEFKQQVVIKTDKICTESDLSFCLSNIPNLIKYSHGSWGPVMNIEFDGITTLPKSDVFLLGDIMQAINDDGFQKVDLMTGYTQMEDVLSVMDDRDVDRGVNEVALKDLMLNIANEDVMESLHLNNDTCTPSTEALYDAILFYYSPQPLGTDKMRYYNLINLITERKYGASTYKQALEVSNTGAKTFMYRFDYKLKTKIPNDINLNSDNITVPHYYDLPFVWGMPYYQSWAKISAWNNFDRKYTDMMMQMWTNFARSSNPVQSGVGVKWDSFDKDAPVIMLLDRNPNMTDPLNPQGVDYKAFEFWGRYYPKIKEFEIGCCNITAGSSQLQHESLTVAIWSIFLGIEYLTI